MHLYSPLTLDLNSTRIESAVARRHHMRIVLRHNRHDGHAGLDSEMKSALLERQQHRIIGVTPRALGENEHTLAVDSHLFHGAIERFHGSLAVGPVDEDRPRERHEPAQEGNIPQGLLRGHAAIWRENGAEHEHVQFGLVVADEDGGTGGEMFLTLDDIEGHAGGEAHHPLEAAGGGPLRDTAVAGESEDDRGKHAVDRAQEQGAIGG